MDSDHLLQNSCSVAGDNKPQLHEPKAVTACGPFWGSSYELLCESVVPASLEHWRRLCGPYGGGAMSNDDAFSPFVEFPQRAVAGLERRTAGTCCRVQKLRKSLFFFFSFSVRIWIAS